MDFNTIVQTRRSVKPERFTGEPVPDEIVQQMLANANWAPTHGYTEPWRFVVFSGDGKKKLIDFLNDLDSKINEPNLVRAEKRTEKINASSHVIAIGMKRGNNPKIPEIEEVLAVGMAVQNLWLTAHNFGAGGYWSTGKLAFRPEFAAFMGLEKSDISMGIFYVGIPVKNLPEGKRLTPIAAKVTWHS